MTPTLRAGVAIVVALAGAVVVAAATFACVPTQVTGDGAVCCACLNQKSPVNDGNAIDPAENCLPPASDAGPGENDGCNGEVAAFIADPSNPDKHQIHVVDELCTTQTCQQECNGLTLDGAKFVVAEQSLSQ